MIHPYLRDARNPLVVQAEALVRAGAVKLLRRVQELLAQAKPFMVVTYSPFSGSDCPKEGVESPTVVSLCGATADQLKAVLQLTGVSLNVNDASRSLGKAGDVKAAIDSALRRLTFSPLDVLPYVLVGAALWMLRPSKGLLAGYPAEMARGAVYAGDCEEAQRRIDMAWKGLQQMENRGDPQFVHEANKVAKLARQIRDNGCEVI